MDSLCRRGRAPWLGLWSLTEAGKAKAKETTLEEAKLTPALYPLLRRLFTLQLNPNTVADALEQTTRIVDEVERRIADGRRFLWGATLSDLAFATALAPLLLPDGYTAPIPKYIDSFRRRPSSALVSRIYNMRCARHHRSARPAFSKFGSFRQPDPAYYPI